MQIDDHGFWYGTNVGHVVDYGLAHALCTFFLSNGTNTILDLGCGNGRYTEYLRDHGFSVLGVDGNPDTKKFDKTLIIEDLTKEHYFGTFEWVLSLEVGEHIPKEFETQFINNLSYNNTRGIVLSWSVPEFGGDGHVNSKTNEEVIDIFTKKGYIKNDIVTKVLRESCARYPNDGWWFSETLLVFERRG